ncbi:MAG: hypothetical protein GX271_04445 [Clostridiales bacterium]|nr:hypothetical protein [Clostridiales bacterium]
MKRILVAYKDLLSIIFEKAPFMVILTFLCTIISGLIWPVNVYVKQHIFDDGLAVARGDIYDSQYRHTYIYR